jgi:hypothetical protein
MNNVIWFILEGETSNDDFVQKELGVMDFIDFNDAVNTAVDEATGIILENGGSGTINIIYNNEFITNVVI